MLVRRSLSGLAARLSSQIPSNYIGLAFNFHDGWGWYLLRAEPKGDPLLQEIRRDAESKGHCVALMASDGTIVERTMPCARKVTFPC